MHFVKTKQRSLFSALRGLYHWFITFIFRKKEFEIEIPELELSFILPSPTTFSFHIAKYRSWEGQITNWIISRFSGQNSLCLVDIGANFGWYTCLFSILGNDSKIYSVEPSPDNIFFLKENIKNNNLKNISLFECALGDKRSSLPLYLANPKNPGAHSLIKNTPQQNLNTEFLQVKVNTLDHLFKDLKVIDFMKIDIEGYELNALQGGKNILKKVNNLLIEFSPHLWERPYKDSLTFFEILEDSGLKPNILDYGSLKKINSLELKEILEFIKYENLNEIPFYKIQKDLIFTRS